MDPTGDAEIVARVTEIAASELDRFARLLSRRYGATVDLPAAEWLAADALIETGRRFDGRRDGLRNLFAYLTKVAQRKALKAAELGLRAVAPGAHAHWVRTGSAFDRLAAERPDLPEETLRQLALAEADALVGRNGFAMRDAGVDVTSDVGVFERGYDDVEFAGVLEMIDRVVAVLAKRDSRSLYEETWWAFKANGFAGSGLGELLGVSPTTASTRLGKLLEKLRGLVPDWRAAAGS